MAVPPFRWNSTAGRYVTPSGQFAKRSDVRAYLDTALQRAERRVMLNASDLQARRITLAEWQTETRDAVRLIHLYSAAAARGGWAQMSPAEFGHVGAELRFQYEKLQAFALEIEAGLPLDGRFLTRAGMYAQAGRKTYTRADQRVHAERGYDQELNVLDKAAETCEDCRAETAREWVKLGTLVRIGERRCRVRCRCRLRFRNSRTGKETD